MGIESLVSKLKEQEKGTTLGILEKRTKCFSVCNAIIVEEILDNKSVLDICIHKNVSEELLNIYYTYLIHHGYSYNSIEEFRGSENFAQALSDAKKVINEKNLSVVNYDYTFSSIEEDIKDKLKSKSYDYIIISDIQSLFRNNEEKVILGITNIARKLGIRIVLPMQLEEKVLCSYMRKIENISGVSSDMTGLIFLDSILLIKEDANKYKTISTPHIVVQSIEKQKV